MTDTRVADVLDAVHDLIAAVPSIATAITDGSLRLYDGPPITDWSADTIMVIGGHPIREDESETSITWDWATLGRSGAFADVDEAIEIPCGVTTHSGDLDMRTLRRIAIGHYAAAASAVRASTLGIAEVMWCTTAVSGVRQLQTESGAECFVAFIVRVRTRI